MKTLIISGTVTLSKEIGLKDGTYCYNVALFGQTNEHPVCVYIVGFQYHCSGYNDLIDFCKTKYANYFKTDLFNIITLDNIIHI